MLSDVDRLAQVWQQYDANPPLAELQEIAGRFPVFISEKAIHDVGQRGSLASYAKHIVRFVQLRTQSHRLIRWEAA